MPCGKEIRWWRRVPEEALAVIRQGKGTSSISSEPIEQKFLSSSTLEKPLSPGATKEGGRYKMAVRMSGTG